MSEGGYFNQSGRRSGGYRRARIAMGQLADCTRAAYLAILAKQIRATGLTGKAFEEVMERLRATDTDTLRECVGRDAVGTAFARTRTVTGDSAEGLRERLAAEHPDAGPHEKPVQAKELPNRQTEE